MQTMIHRSSKPYAEAVSEAARVARVKMEELVHRGVTSAEKVIETIMARSVVDRVVKTPAVRLIPTDGAFQMAFGTQQAKLHPFAYSQILNDAGLPKRFVDSLAAEKDGLRWSPGLVANIVNTVFEHRTTQRNLIRAESDTIKGFVSDKFKRIDSRPLLESFAKVCQETGLKPYEGIGTDTKVLIRAVVPAVFEPIENEAMVFGVEWRNSDFGDGGHTLNLTMTRMVCTNLAIADSCLRQIHLGKRLHDDVRYSEQTYRLDTQANASALRDVVRAAIGPDRIDGMLEAIRTASENELPDDKNVIVSRLKKYMSAPDADRVYMAFDGPDVVNLPPGNTAWRLSNAASWIAQSKDVSPERKLELQAAAGDLIPRKAEKAIEV